MILPGATVGVLGGGQLGRMFTLQARTMGYGVVVLDPDPQSPPEPWPTGTSRHPTTTRGPSPTFPPACAAVTTEFENVPAAALETLSRSALWSAPR